jgi:hypothetical protein
MPTIEAVFHILIRPPFTCQILLWVAGSLRVFPARVKGKVQRPAQSISDGRLHNTYTKLETRHILPMASFGRGKNEE